ncbi:30S ribosomal protein S6e [Methanoculleus bourgensis]|jgi:small subunit ribosomal protein S6e|uniref:Small ribosomal subunit protein eS6 n=1 Tax=Methanoculleus bourgensis TaxID=83986 RepID=A0A7K4C428_9EURY|nr:MULTISPECIES: 30S ribosomal protein S6e [Methanoculleus]MBT0733926.1 30S ribosomal protein S6e [Methanoculleus bourgensis]MDD3373338.1 30S ribosomal protein S6e [Methanoculleus bourgensis]NMA88837.1 30S ribosomal protein S6e [Methanoculleus bourgensis]NQS78853.1 30S ribosomal protein S6e [Methanoculleus bourgensis]SAI87569.1 30S ribosomal protein S6e [Methanoculleus bourgensis]
MVDFKIILSDPDTGRSYKIDATGPAAGALIGKRIGDEIDGGVFGLAGYTIKITGGTDRTGIPARRDLPGPARRRILLSEGVGFHPIMEGQRRRKSVRGNEISADFVQINAAVKQRGAKPLTEYFEEPKAAAE